MPNFYAINLNFQGKLGIYPNKNSHFHGSNGRNQKKYIITKNSDFGQNCPIQGKGKIVNTESKKLPEFLRIILKKKEF